MSKESRQMFRELAVYSQSGMTFVFSIFVGLGIGWYLDHKVFDGRTVPYLTFIFLGLGIIAGFKHLWELSRRANDS
jgi:F0F1-type ATP synthase assembly protein I